MASMSVALLFGLMAGYILETAQGLRKCWLQSFRDTA